MNKGLKLLIPILSVLMLTMFISCTGESDTPIPDPGKYPQTGGDLDNPAGTGSGLESKGGLFPVKAVSYDAQAAIKLYIKDDAAEGGFRALANGDYVEPFEQTIGITVSPRQDGEKVYVSNGSTYTEEAFINESGMYVCSFNFEYNKMAYLAQPVLIQAIYKDGYASKKKYVLATRKDYRAGDGILVEPGLVISVGKNVFGGLSAAVGGLLGEDATVNAFSPADNSTGSKKGVMHLEVDGLISGDMIVMDTDGDDVRGVNIAFEDATVTNIPILKKLLGILINDKPLLSLGPVAFDLGAMLGGLGGEDSEGDLLASILGGLDIDKQLFFNAYGIPEATTTDYAVLGGGLYIAEGDTLSTDEAGEYLFPIVTEDYSRDTIDREGVKTGDHDMGVALSHYNLNQVLGGIAKKLVVELPAAALPIPLAIPAMDPGNSQIVKVTINPAGLNIDLAAYPGTATPARMDILDMRMEYYQNDDAMWVMSFDISLALAIGLSTDGKGGLSLDLALTPLDVPSFNNCHVMKDRMGIGMFDNSTFVALLFEALAEMTGGAPGDPFMIGLPLDSFGLIPAEGVDPGVITYDDKGNCFMNLALSNIDAGGLCFISSAGLF